MKFARYLQDTQIPEWEKAYIDYNGLKALLGAIRSQSLLQVESSSSFGNTLSDHTQNSHPNGFDESEGGSTLDDQFVPEYGFEMTEDLNRGITTPARIGNPLISGADHMIGFHGPNIHRSPSSIRSRTDNNGGAPSFSLAMASLPDATGTVSSVPAGQIPSSRTQRPPVTHRSQHSSAGSHAHAPPPLHTILSNLPPTHGKFFDMLDAELGKVASFYSGREKEMHERSKLLRKQFEELEVHRQLFYDSFGYSEARSWVQRTYHSMSFALSTWFSSARHEELHPAGGHGVLAPELEHGAHGFVDRSNFGIWPPERARLGDHHSGRRRRGKGTVPAMTLDDTETSKVPSKHSEVRPVSIASKELDPRAYKHAKLRLRKAVAEHYRGLEALNNYRIVNLTGFRKALRKYEQITQSEFVLEAYMKEKIKPSAFASGATVGSLLREMETLYAIRFERGDRKKARDHLRVGLLSKVHDLSTFRVGLWLGLAVPAIVAGSELSFQEYTRRTLPSWNILLLIYSIFLIPLALVLLVGVNILIWARSRINYVFIFKLNPRFRHDYQGYFELPSFLFCTLAYGYWFSMAQIGPPMLWPLIWLALTVAIMFNPFHSFMWGGTRWWTIKKVAKLGASGIWNVEFTDLWLGDQFCSLVYPLCNLFFLGCYYTHFDILSSGHDPQAQEALIKCGITRNWGWYCFLGMWPFLARIVQSMRRYRDSKRPEHLVNAGKYSMGTIQFFFYCYWRHLNRPNAGRYYIFFWLSATINSIYACAWEVFVDWSMCQPYARYPLLRREIVFKTHLNVYYFSLVSDLLIRFNWLLYIFFGEASIELRVFAAALLEIFRRAQWNIYRVENKHLANMEEYRVTRELPVPYHHDTQPTEEEVYLARLRLRMRLAREH